MRAYEWVVKPAKGSTLAQCLNGLSDAGYEVFKIFEHGVQVQSSMLDTSQQTAMPLFSVVARRIKGAH